MKQVIYFVLTLLLSAMAVASDLNFVSGHGAIRGEPIKIAAEKNRPLVVVFLSARCPCSHSHLDELRTLAQEFSSFKFVAVHSNSDEDERMAKDYFQTNPLPFPAIKDVKAALANKFKANKTPHAFVVNENGDIEYQGGVSSSERFQKAERKYLREALTDLVENKLVRTPHARTLGCAIGR